MDAISNLLGGMRLTGGVFLEAEFTAPWCVTSRVEPHDYLPFTPAPRQVIAYHYVTAGLMLLKAGDRPPVEVRRGEIVVLPRNDPHLIGSALDIRPVGEEHLIKTDGKGGPVRIVHGGGGERTCILCGYLGDDMPHNPVTAMLPGIMKVDVADCASGGWMESSFSLAAKELSEGGGGSPAFLARLAELLFVELVRRYLDSRPEDAGAWEAGLQDPVVGRALGLLHGQMARRWTTEELASEIGLSRSAFADRFTRAVGEPPMRYLLRLRLSQAGVLLRESAAGIAAIAQEVGYDSEAAFSRAFRRERGVPPAAWRRADGPEEGRIRSRRTPAPPRAR